jgi:HSP20 family protein
MAAKDVETREGSERTVRPACLVCEEDRGQIVMQLEMPGVNQDHLDLRYEDNTLHITGRRETRSADVTYLVRERRSGTFYQAYTLDHTIDPEKIEASIANGVLSVTLHRKQAEKPREITVKSG